LLTAGTFQDNGTHALGSEPTGGIYITDGAGVQKYMHDIAIKYDT
jgi:hypothetical protein